MVRFAQWIIGFAVMGASGVATFVLLSSGEVDQLRREKEALTREKFELQRSIERLTSESRVAEVHVVDQVLPGDVVDGRTVTSAQTTLDFIEIDREGHPLPSRRVTIQGTTPSFKAMVVRFDHEHVAMGDSLRGRSLALFLGVYGDEQRPVDAVSLDEAGEVPNVYRVNRNPNPFEQKLWSRFWDYAKDPALREKDGVRLTQGEAPWMPMRKGEVWTISLQHDAGLHIQFRHAGAATDAGAARPDA